MVERDSDKGGVTTKDAPDAAQLSEAMDRLEREHDAVIREGVPRLEALARRALAQQARAHDRVLSVIVIELATLRADLEAHVAKEEEMLFPVVRSLVGGETPLLRQGDELLLDLTHEHENAADILARIRRLTGNFAVPDDAGEAFRRLYEALEQFETDLGRHFELETEFLLPGARMLMKGGTT